MSQNMKRPSLPSPAGSQARSIFSGGLFQVGTPDQLSTSLVSCRNFKIFQYTISTQCAVHICLQSNCGKINVVTCKILARNEGQEQSLCFYTRFLKKWILSLWNVKSCWPSFTPIHHNHFKSQFCPWNTVAKEISLQILRVQHSTAGGTLGGVLRTIVLRRVLELGIRRVTTNFHNRRRHCLLFVKSGQHLHCHI